MIVCSKEEPVINNESLYQRKGTGANLILDSSAGFNINRYCFVYKNGNYNSAFPKLLKAVLNYLNLKVFIVLCWSIKIPGKSKVASKVIEKRYEKRSWDVFQRNTHYIAVKEILDHDIKKWPPAGENLLDGGIVLILGDYSKKEILSIVSDEDCVFLAENKYFAPDDRLLSKLEKNKAAILYQENDEFNNNGLVLVGDVTIDIEYISKTISIAQIFEGESAYKIFV